MMTNSTFRAAVSAVAIGATMVACTPNAATHRLGSASARPADTPEQKAVAAYARANAAVHKGDVVQALGHAEQAVELSPRDSGFRMLLADLYLKNGRFLSAEATFADVLTLDPGNKRASISIALARIALGRTGAALATLDELSLTADPADVGLAYALAGQPQRAVELLEPAARAEGATGRVRQNLALAYALAGDWQKARTTAAQDVSPAELGARMEQWASFAQPRSQWDQVASLLGVTPVVDEGQPVRLALAPAQAAAIQMAAAAPAPEPAPEPAPAPVEVAAVEVPQWVPAASEPVPAPESEPAPEPAEETVPVYARAVQTLVTPQPVVLRASAPKIEAPVRSFDSPPPRARAERPRAAPTAAGGRFVVQLGAFSSAAGVERAWASLYKRYGLAERTPLSTTVRIEGKGTFHRLSVSGFDSRAEAAKACQSVKAKGGVCFVRTVAGDAPTRWASRYTGRPA